MAGVGDTFVYKGRVYPKYQLKEHEDEDFVILTDEWKEYLTTLKVKQYLCTAGIPVSSNYGLASYIGDDKDRNIPKLIKYCAEFKTKFKNTHLYLWSHINGTQKSTCAKDIIARLAEKGVQGYFVLMDDLIHSLVKAERSEEELNRVNVWRDAPFLVIDECFSKGQVVLFASGYQKSFINTFLKHRLEIDKRATCFTSNTPITEIGAIWGAGLQSLVERSVSVRMYFNDTVVKTTFDTDDIWETA